VFIDGEFIGGSDVIIELHHSGALAQLAHAEDCGPRTP
jgi:glutaredoxin-related protein